MTSSREGRARPASGIARSGRVSAVSGLAAACALWLAPLQAMPAAERALASETASQAASAQPPAGEIAGRLQTHYDAVRDFSADFTHTYEGGVLRKKTTERGTVLVKKPGKMRWTYTSPEEKLFVSDGRKMYAWIPADRQVTVSSLPSGDEPATPILFLVGRGNVTRDFNVTHATAVAGAPADAYALHLVPKRKVPDYESLTIVVDRASFALRMLVARDGQAGTSTFSFTNLKENVGVADSKFAFTIPRGAEVVQGS
jgi:outer membrane lipoprotein carrier protein